MGHNIVKKTLGFLWFFSVPLCKTYFPWSILNKEEAGRHADFTGSIKSCVTFQSVAKVRPPRQPNLHQTIYNNQGLVRWGQKSTYNQGGPHCSYQETYNYKHIWPCLGKNISLGGTVGEANVFGSFTHLFCKPITCTMTMFFFFATSKIDTQDSWTQGKKWRT